ncbi:MAG: hypothetical protein ABEJ72_08120, partial [Candidatus Aenigmatarchaeota archaeon]
EKSAKAHMLESMNKAVTDAGQALLIGRGVDTTVPKKLPDKLDKISEGEDKLPEDILEGGKEVIQTWKDFEHRELEVIEWETLEDLMSKTIDFVNTAETYIEEKEL